MFIPFLSSQQSQYIKVVYDTVKHHRPITLLLDKKTCLQFESQDREKYENFFRCAISVGKLRIILVEELEFSDSRLDKIHKKYLFPNAIGGNPVVASDAYRILLNLNDFFCRDKNTYIDFDMLESVLKNDLWTYLSLYTSELNNNNNNNNNYTCSKKEKNNDIVGAKRSQIDLYKDFLIKIFNNRISFYLKSIKNIAAIFSDPINIGECINNGQTYIYKDFSLKVLQIPLYEKFNVYSNKWSEGLMFHLRNIKEPCPALELCLKLIYYAKKYSLYNREPYVLPFSVYEGFIYDEEGLAISEEDNSFILLKNVFLKNTKKSKIEEIMQKKISKLELSIDDKNHIIKYLKLDNPIKKDCDLLTHFDEIYGSEFSDLCEFISHFLNKTFCIDEEFYMEDDDDCIIIEKVDVIEGKDDSPLYEGEIYYPPNFNFKQKIILDRIWKNDGLLLSAFLDKYDPKIYMRESNFMRIYKFVLNSEFQNIVASDIYTRSLLILFMKNQINELFYRSYSEKINSLLCYIKELIERGLFEKFLGCINERDLIFDRVGILYENIYNTFCSVLNDTILEDNKKNMNGEQKDILFYLIENNVIDNVEKISLNHLDKLTFLKEISLIDVNLKHLNITKVNFNFIEKYMELLNSRKVKVSVKNYLQKINLKLHIEKNNSDQYITFYKKIISFLDNWEEYEKLEEYSKKYEIYPFIKNKMEAIACIINCHPDTFYKFGEDLCINLCLNSSVKKSKISEMQVALLSEFLRKLTLK